MAGIQMGAKFLPKIAVILIVLLMVVSCVTPCIAVKSALNLTDNIYNSMFSGNNQVSEQDDREICDNLYNSGDYVAAAECYLNLTPPDYWLASGSYGWAGNIAYEQGDYEVALSYYLLEIQYSELTTDHNKIGEAYYHAGQASYEL